MRDNRTVPSDRSTDAPVFASQETFWFVVGWWVCFLIYPLWYVPGTPGKRWAVALLLMALWLLVSVLFRYLAAYSYIQEETTKPSEPSDIGFFLPAFAVAFLCHLPFLNQPILTGLDTIDHAAVPGIVADRILDAARHALGFSVQPLLLGFLALLAAGMIAYPNRRRQFHRGWNRLFGWTVRRGWMGLLFLSLAALVFIAVVNTKALPERFGDITTLFRYPPLSKVFFIPLHVIFGLQDWVGQAIQLFFNFAGAWYLYQIARLFGGRDAARMSALFFLFLPPLFHYAHTHMIDSGTLFFVAAAFYYAIHYIETKTPLSLVRACFFMTFGFLYKHPVVSVIPAFALMVAYDFFFPRPRRLRPALIPSIIACAIPSLTVVAFMKLSDINPETPSDVNAPNLFRFAANLAAVPGGVTWPVALLFLAGFLYLAFRKDRRPFWILLCWIGTHYFISCMSKIYFNVRQSLPYYLGLSVMASLALEQAFPRREALRRSLLFGVLPLYLISACLFWRHPLEGSATERMFGDRSYINFSNWYEAYLPYGTIVEDLKRRTAPGDTVFAPMANEPVEFYLAKFDFGDRRYIRRYELWTPRNEQTVEGLLRLVKDRKVDWVLLPRGRWLSRYVNLDLVESIFQHPPDWLQPVTIYQYGTVQVGLWKVTR